ncbi:hypothetical protein E2562_018626 [Oryza meyeriana var. granulata]|uniref:Uncharacterized protein n=1 Tax=Oryza meyeriana var. granulata TaxID=110450 RepID=A0A6G1BZL1_9ORYZ|nr:hypothetical protein E2562_018626 [Oryza meyeriana var. granulata]
MYPKEKDKGNAKTRDLRTFSSGGGTSNLFAGDGGATNLLDVEVEIEEHEEDKDDFDSDEFDQAVATVEEEMENEMAAEQVAGEVEDDDHDILCV